MKDSSVICRQQDYKLDHEQEHSRLQQLYFDRNRGRIYCLGFQVWKHAYIRTYLRSPSNQIVFARNAQQAIRAGFDSDARLVVWGYRLEFRSAKACGAISGRYLAYGGRIFAVRWTRLRLDCASIVGC